MGNVLLLTGKVPWLKKYRENAQVHNINKNEPNVNSYKYNLFLSIYQL